MAPDNELSRYVRDALERGQTRDQCRTALTQAGWTDPEIDAALESWLMIDGHAAVPRPVRSTAARDALFYALLFVVFGMVAGSTLTLLFAQINLWLPEPDETGGYARLTGLRWSMAALIVFIPVFWLLDRKDRSAAAADSARKHGTVRRWLSAIAMLIAVITLLGDALYLIYSWLNGQITVRFLAKSATVAVMAFIVLAYFRETRDLPIPRIPLPTAWVLTGLALVSLGLSFWLVGGPSQGQMEQRDRWRVADLRMLAGDLVQCTEIDRAALPETVDPMTCARNPMRLTGYASDITYERLSATEFKLCTVLEFPPAVWDYGLQIDANTACIQRSTD